MRDKFRLMACCYLLLGLASFSSANGEQLTLVPTPTSTEGKWEKWVERTPVTGGLRVGVMVNVVAAMPVPDPTYATVRLTEITAKKLCVELTSHDGRYSAALDYDISGVQPGWYRFEIPTEEVGHLQKFNQDQLVVLANLSDECDGSAGTYLAVDWKSDWGDVPRIENDFESVHIFLNSRVPTTIYRTDGHESIGEPFLCVQQQGPRTSFNLRCEIPKDAIDIGKPLLITTRRGRSVKPYELHLSVK